MLLRSNQTVIIFLLVFSLGGLISFPVLASNYTEEEMFGEKMSSERIEQLVEETREASQENRKNELNKIIEDDSYLPYGVWGDTNWCLAALYLNEKVEKANEILLKNSKEQTNFNPIPADVEGSPWAYFALPDYIRILSFFREDSEHYPGRLNSETEKAMKEALWNWVSDKSKVSRVYDLIDEENYFTTRGTENHDLTERPAFYLASYILSEDPEYADRKYDDGNTPEEHFQAWNEYYKNWPKHRATKGMWIEIGATGYQKYSYPPLFNLYELSPDPVVRKRFKMLLDIAFIEEAQISIDGVRGGGKSRATFGSGFEKYKDLLYGENGYGSHSRVIETSDYQLPEEAILLRKFDFPAEKPFVIYNRVPGELHPDDWRLQPGRHPDNVRRGRHPDNLQYLRFDSALINYAYRAPHYIIGSTLQDPNRDYAPNSRQKRWSGIIFEDLNAIYPVIDTSDDTGRPQDPYWNFQHENVMILQELKDAYATQSVGIKFSSELDLIEKEGWIFTDNETAFAAVRPVKGKYVLQENRMLPEKRMMPIIIQAGDLSEYDSFEDFKGSVLNNTLEGSRQQVEYSGPDQPKIEFYSEDMEKLPRVEGQEVDLKPEYTYNSPILKAEFSDTEVRVNVGQLRTIYDFENNEVIEKGIE